MMAVSTDGSDSFLKHIDTFEGGTARRVGPASELRSCSVLVLASPRLLHVFLDLNSFAQCESHCLFAVKPGVRARGLIWLGDCPKTGAFLLRWIDV
jgi:hypothetical protein